MPTDSTEMSVKQTTSGQTSWLPIRVKVVLYHSTPNVGITDHLSARELVGRRPNIQAVGPAISQTRSLLGQSTSSSMQAAQRAMVKGM
jgi:hypothetical protein